MSSKTMIILPVINMKRIGKGSLVTTLKGSQFKSHVRSFLTSIQKNKKYFSHH